jgi:Ca2+/Na+ antiporter
MNTLMKVLKWVAYISAGLGAILILIGVISGLTLKHKLQAIYIASYFLAGNSFLLVAVVILLFIHLDQHKKV